MLQWKARVVIKFTYVRMYEDYSNNPDGRFWMIRLHGW
jgi:hypothetical protein